MSSAIAAASSKSRVLSAYRRLNRARIQLFQGDSHAMQVTHQQMRAEFARNRHVPTSGPEFEAMVAGIDEAATMLQHEIIRGELNTETGRYQMKIKKEHVAGSADGTTKPEVELITEDTVKRMENPETVQVCKSSNNKK